MIEIPYVRSDHGSDRRLEDLFRSSVLTHDAIGFGYYQGKDLGELQANLEAGMGANQAAGFSGSVYPLDRLRRIEINERRKRVIVQFRDLILSDKDDFNFSTDSGCREFCDCLLENLGPGWARGLAPKRNFWLTALPVVGLVVVLFFIAISINLLLTGPEPVVDKAGKVRTQAESIQAGLMCSGVSIAGLIAFGFWLFAMIKWPRMVDSIYKRN